MATIYAQKDAESLNRALVKAFNDFHDATVVTYGDGYHRDITSTVSGDWRFPGGTALTVSAANATDLVTSLTLAENIRGVLFYHMKDGSAHNTKDGYNTAFHDGYVSDGYSSLKNLTDLQKFLNATKVNFNAHLTQTVGGAVHRKNDTVNSVSTADATDQTSANNLANALKTAINAHMASGPSFGRIRLSVLTDNI